MDWASAAVPIQWRPRTHSNLEAWGRRWLGAQQRFWIRMLMELERLWWGDVTLQWATWIDRTGPRNRLTMTGACVPEMLVDWMRMDSSSSLDGLKRSSSQPAERMSPLFPLKTQSRVRSRLWVKQSYSATSWNSSPSSLPSRYFLSKVLDFCANVIPPICETVVKMKLVVNFFF